MQSHFKAIISFINRDYPYYYNNLKHNILVSIIAPIFVIFFMVLKPQLAVSLIEKNYTLLTIMLTIIPLITPHFFFLFGPVFLKKWFKSWKTYKEIVYTISCVSTVGILNYTSLLFYGKNQSGIGQFEIIDFFQIYTITLISGIIPLTIVILINNLRHNPNINKGQIIKVLEEILMPSKSKLNPTIEIENNGVNYSLAIEKINAIKSMGNYLRIYADIDKGITVLTARSTTKEMEEFLTANGNFFRPHKSYIINCDKIDDVSGNISNGLKVSVSNVDFQVPVSRSRAKTFKQLTTND